MKNRRKVNSQPKIRRYKKIYNKRTLKPLWTVLFILGLGVVFFLSWSLYQPIIDFFSGSMESSKSSSDASSKAEPEPQRSEPEPLPVPDEPADDAVRAVYMPLETLYNGDKLDGFLQMMSDNGLNCILLDIKTQEGYLTYTSSLPQVKDTAAIMDGAISNMADTVSLLKARGIGVIANIHVFRDPVGSRSDYDKAVHYLGSNLFWLDDSKENGGKTWLNPCSQKARDYVISIAGETAQMGFDAIIFSDVCFPGRLGAAYTDYGVEVTEDNKADYLSMFADEALEALSDFDVQVYFSSPAVDSISGDTFSYGAKPVTIAKNGYAPTLYPSEYDASRSAYDAVTAQLKKLGDYIDPEDEASLAFLPLLQAFGGYGPDDIAQQISALEDRGFNSYIIYSEDGVYPLSE